MPGLAESILALVEPIVGDVDSPVHRRHLASAFDKYYAAIETSLARYRDHLGKKTVEIGALRRRYILETAILHVLTQLLLLRTNNEGSTTFLWPVNEEEGFFTWYQLPSRLQEDIGESLAKLKAAHNLELTLSYTLDQVFRTTGIDYLGEYYTPLPIARHILQLSELKSSHVLDSRRIVDPSCGGGVLLLLAAQQIIADLDASKSDPQAIIDMLSASIHGFDIQPFAVTLTRSLLTSVCTPLLHTGATFLESPFPRVQVQDPLATRDGSWTHSQFDWILGNPPFQPVKKAGLDYADAYADILYGHPNLYQLFLWWAVLAARPDGRIAFLLPQSLLAGSYFQRLRQELFERVQLLAVTRLIERKGIVGNADQQMMAIALKANGHGATEQSRDVAIRVTWNGDDIDQTPVHFVASERVTQSKNKQIIWIVSEKNDDYELLEALERSSNLLAQMKHLFLLNNGEYVWNQHKHLLSREYVESSYPLVSSACVGRYSIKFPYSGSHPTRTRSFSRLDPSVSNYLHSGPMILVQRTTRRKVGRRLVAGMLGQQFYTEYGKYFVENHVNYVTLASDTSVDFLYGLLAWFNSDLMNFVFQLENGTPHVSITDLGLLPVPLDVVAHLVEPAKSICSSTEEEKGSQIAEINELLFNHYHLSPNQRKRIQFVLDRAERKPRQGHA
ncbi:N-6 DNA methylase [Aggregatilinea lenta]|uniref:N-6 DNA methylase n=1 Tax=Aggregatilinea lenta TaxID=913108 RepID=UPI000E5AC760|nr:N-6 DNA methylase [Aggregatilinea lenta]